ncbi:hypothetical protein BDFB_011170, partial [Asbolus verrucosus]
LGIEKKFHFTLLINFMMTSFNLKTGQYPILHKAAYTYFISILSNESYAKHMASTILRLNSVGFLCLVEDGKLLGEKPF